MALDLGPEPHIVVRAPNWVGDAVMALPFLRGLLDRVPHGRLTIAGRRWVLPLFERVPRAELWPYEDQVSLPRRPFRWIWLAQRMRSLRPDAVFLLPTSFSSAAVPFLARVRHRIGYAGDGRRLLLTHPLSPHPRLGRVHRSDVYLRLLTALGGQPPTSRTELPFPVTRREIARARTFLTNYEIDPDQPLIGVAPGSVGRSRRWSPSRFAHAARIAARHLGARVLLLGSSGDRSLVSAVSAELPDDVHFDLCGAVPLATLPGIIACCRIFLSNDTGAAHVAALSQTPIVVLFGAGDETVTRPLSPRTTVIRRYLDCTPCGQNDCHRGDLACLEAIEAVDVGNTLQRVLADS